MTAVAPTRSVVSAENRDLFRREGYMILERVIPDDLLEMLRAECSYFLGYCDGQMDLRGVKSQGLNHRGKRYFISNSYRLSQHLHKFIYSPLMADITTAALGPDVQLFHEQWVIKGAEQGMKFAWHQDSGYVKHGDPKVVHPPYLTCWCPLDDVSEANGTVFLLPHSRGGTSHTVFDHHREAVTNDLIGYTGSDPGIPIIAPAGSVVAFTSYNFHRSGANTTKALRRVYLPQYTGTPLLKPDGSRWAMTVPFVKDGRIVYDHATDTAKNHGGHPGINE